MITMPVGPNMLMVFGRNGALIGSISKAFGSFYARPVNSKRAIKYATEAEAAAHFGF